MNPAMNPATIRQIMGSESSMRRDGVLIMARGDSRRMGQPKGMVRLPGESRTFGEMIASLYKEAGWPVTIIIKPEDETAYSPLLELVPQLDCIHETGGRDTAQTVLAAWGKISERPTHLWVHPVDMPMIGWHTIAMLLAESRKHPAAILRPVHEKKPGHPVIMPATCLDVLEELHQGLPWPPGPVRSMVKDAVARNLVPPMREVPVGDAAVTRDFDSISDLEEGF